MPSLKRKNMKTIKDLRDQAESGRESVERVGVIVSALQERKSGRGTRFFRMNISDPTGQVSGMALFPDDFEAVRKVFEQTHQVVMTLEARFNEGQFDPIARSVAPIETVAAAGAAAGLNVMIDTPDAAAMIQSVLDRYKEDASVKVKGPVRVTVLSVPLEEATQDIPIELGTGWPVSPQIKGALKSLPGVVMVEELIG